MVAQGQAELPELVGEEGAKPEGQPEYQVDLADRRVRALEPGEHAPHLRQHRGGLFRCLEVGRIVREHERLRRVACAAPRADVGLLEARASLQEPDVRTWSRTRDAAQPLVLAHYPADLETPEQAAAVLAEVRGVLTWLKRAYPAIGEVDLVLGLPLGLCALLAHELRQLGLTLRYHDQIYPPAPPWYRLVKTWA